MIEFKEIKKTSPSLERLKEIVHKTHINGGLIISNIEMDSNLLEGDGSTLSTSWYMIKNFLRSDFFKDKYPDLIIEDDFFNIDENRIIKDSLLLDSLLASMISKGGAYGGGWDKVESKKIGTGIVNELFQERYNDLNFYYIFGKWTEWHFDMPWNYTFFIIDKKYHQLWFITTTDTD